jgi:hypothetical protein
VTSRAVAAIFAFSTAADLTGAGTMGCDGAQAGNRRPRVIKTENTISEGLKILMINLQNDN